MEGFFEAKETLVERLGNSFGVMRLIGGELAEGKEREVWERICGGGGRGGSGVGRGKGGGINRWSGELS